MQALGPSSDRTRSGRLLAALFGVIAFACFFVPWVSAALPNRDERALTGLEVARGPDAATLAGAGAAALATRRPTATAGEASGSTGTAGGAEAAPTRQPSGPEIATAAAATAFAVQTVQAGGRPATAAAAATEPERLPASLLFGLPLAAAGVAVFAAIWGQLRDRRDRLYGRLWTILLSAGGTLGAGYVLAKVLRAPHPNDLLGPGDVRGAQWGLWATFVAFLLSALSLALAWSGRARPRSV